MIIIIIILENSNMKSFQCNMYLLVGLLLIYILSLTPNKNNDNNKNNNNNDDNKNNNTNN